MVTSRRGGKAAASSGEAASGSSESGLPGALEANDKNGLVIDPSAEKSSKPATNGKSKSKAPTGRDEQKFFEDTGREYELRQNEQDLGWLGKFFGNTAAPTNIAGLIAIVCVCVFILTLFLPVGQGNDSQRLADAQKYIFGLISSALGFLFGASRRK
ncbi:hypothetical protein HBDW_43370 [Herbaspirillum sp. DW155]|uniref:hypothetical protein n=1 Tax=Herbaspirillum sp. DW155 TaxID=3095609 RepID=UPI003087305F|nr:hypothetical protein HBDW_43370 [Herbaspirillum sp. DW155]